MPGGAEDAHALVDFLERGPAALADPVVVEAPPGGVEADVLAFTVPEPTGVVGIVASTAALGISSVRSVASARPVARASS